ncbi:hypothetical protein HaLaN_16459 [Haematococcus lacustris]|uniref:Uncharacterized protein n=1 Tax=Haematococcus lacustris TaxID=44745 RepID=A0A699ZL21_HAELA|nr:hypothetical protein HaLaN_16459 [Haematococcus lacustris]
MTDIEHTPDLLRVARTPAIAAKHWKDDSAWQIAEALYSVMRKHDLEVLQSATFLSLSLDEATTVDNRDSQGYLCIDSAAGAGVAAGEQGAQEQGLEGGEVEGGKEGLDTLHQLSAVAPTQGRRGRAGPVPDETLATQQSQFAEVMRDAANSPGMGISQPGDWGVAGCCQQEGALCRDQPRNQPFDGPGPFVTSISLAAGSSRCHIEEAGLRWRLVNLPRAMQVPKENSGAGDLRGSQVHNANLPPHPTNIPPSCYHGWLALPSSGQSNATQVPICEVWLGLVAGRGGGAREVCASVASKGVYEGLKRALHRPDLPTSGSSNTLLERDPGPASSPGQQQHSPWGSAVREAGAAVLCGGCAGSVVSVLHAGGRQLLAALRQPIAELS